MTLVSLSVVHVGGHSDDLEFCGYRLSLGEACSERWLYASWSAGTPRLRCAQGSTSQHVWWTSEPVAYAPGNLGNLFDNLQLRNIHDFLQPGCPAHLLSALSVGACV